MIKSLTTLLLLQLLLLSSAHANDIQTRIIGGLDATKNTYPFMTRLKFKYISKTNCGASLIHERWVLTAAHCVDGVESILEGVAINDWDVTVDEAFEENIGISEVIVHPDFDAMNYLEGHDIALIKLDSASSKTPIEIIGDADYSANKGNLLTIIGWGLVGRTFGSPVSISDLGGEKSNTLRELNNIPLAEPTRCRSNNSERIICLGERENNVAMEQVTCAGDSGGPSFYQQGDRFIQTGIGSYGDGQEEGKICLGDDTGDSVMGFTNAYYYRSWIEKTAGITLANPTPIVIEETPTVVEPTPVITEPNTQKTLQELIMMFIQALLAFLFK